MRTRLTLASLVIVIGAIALGAIRFFGAPHPSPAPPATVTSGATQMPAGVPSPAAVASSPSATAGPAAEPSAIASPAFTPSPETTSTPTTAPTPVPTPTDDSNLLAMRNGAFVRRWTLGGIADGAENLPQESTLAIVPAFGHPVELVFELPSAARIERVGVALRGAKPAQVDVAVGETIGALHAIGSLDLTLPAANDAEQFVNAGTLARFVRFTIRRPANAELRIVRAAAYGLAGSPQRGALSGTWVSADGLAGSPESVFAGVRGSVPDAAPREAVYNPRVAVERDGVLSEFECGYRSATWHGAVAGNVARFAGDRLQLAGDGNLLVGYANDHYIMALRSKPVRACAPATEGAGPVVLALVRVMAEPAAELDPQRFPGYRFERRMTPLLDAAQLAHAHFAILDSDCEASNDLTPNQQRTLLEWIATGHKLIVRDADLCSRSDYAFLPYHFSTQASGAAGARGELLVNADPSTLGAGPGDPVHALDTVAYVKHQFQQIGDSDIVVTDDPHWCGHLFAANRVGANGWVHAYARYGRGLIIYDGFDRDDLNARIAPALRLVAFEYAQPVQAELPCNARVASLLVLAPSVDESLPAGKAIVLHVPMRLTYASKQKTGQTVALSVGGDARYRATVSPTSVRLAPGGGVPIVVSVPLSAGWSGKHAYTVNANGTPGQNAQATISIDASVALAKAFESQRRVRIYGIHFDVDSAVIAPRSEATIEEIAQVLNAHPDWKMRVEGHTDSDGGAAYNKTLSVRRAHAVVADLVARYHIAGSRLTAAGFGLTRPVAPNTTEAGKALNRRVELVRL